MSIKTLGVLAGALTIWYLFTGQPNNYKTCNERYPLPDEIKVVKTSFPYEVREGENLEKILKTKDIDFSKDFVIKTDRYRIIKDDDWFPSRAIGHLSSLPVKLFFWDWDAHRGLDEKRSRAVLSMLEEEKNIKDLTVRINHNEAIYDWYRMMTKKECRDRYPFLYRFIVGSLTTLKNELWAELGRGDYYNPLTKTAVLYSNIESVSAHEIGHDKDFERFDWKWVYDFSRILPPVMIYQEWKASTNATRLMSEEDRWQFNRYLMPALATYVLATIFTIFKKTKNKGDSD